MSCQAELRGLGAVHRALADRGGRILAISVDPPELARKVVDRNRLKFPVLCDTERDVINEYGLVHEGIGPGGSDVAIPAQILVDGDGRILWRYVAERIQDRVDPARVLSVIESRLSAYSVD